MPGSTNEEHEILLMRWFEELWNKKNYDIVQKLASQEYVDHGDGSRDGRKGPEVALETVRTWHAAFPDGRMSIEEIYTEGEKSVVRTTFRGSQNGDFYGIAPSEKKVAVSSVGIMRVLDGKLVESWGDLNTIGVMQQIGALPKPGYKEEN